MNAPIFRLFALFVVMFAVLVGFSSRWAVFGAQRLRENPHNSRVVLEEQRIKRGVIRAADGTVLAGSTALSGGRYTRRYPTGRAVRAARSASTTSNFGRTGLEKEYNDALVGRKEELGRLLDSIVDEGRGRRQPADDAGPEGPAGRLRRARGPQGRRRRARRQDRRGARAGRDAVLRPDRTRASRAPRSSTTPPRASIRPARRSRRSRRPPRSTPAATSPTRRSAARTGR